LYAPLELGFPCFGCDSFLRSNWPMVEICFRILVSETFLLDDQVDVYFIAHTLETQVSFLVAGFDVCNNLSSGAFIDFTC
jgi:hypothetical protein